MEFRKKTVLFGAILALTALTGQSILGMWENEKESPTTPTKGPVVSFDQFLETPTKPKPKMLDEKEEEKLPELSRKNYFRQLRWSFAPFQSTENEKRVRLGKYGFVQTKRKKFSSLGQFSKSCGLGNAGFKDYGYFHLSVMLPQILEKNVLPTFQQQKINKRNKRNNAQRNNNVRAPPIILLPFI